MFLDQNKLQSDQKILLYGYGNPGRQDDGVGPAFIDLAEEWIRQSKIEHISVDSNYQLNIEDAYTIRDYDLVIFIDASIENIDDFLLTRVIPAGKVNPSMHSVSPSFVLDLCKKIYNCAPDTYLLHIKGYEFQLAEGISDPANDNLNLAFEFIKKRLVKLTTSCRVGLNDLCEERTEKVM